MKGKKLISLLLAALLVFSLAACTGGSKVRADEALVGKYNAVVGEMLGIQLVGDDLDDFFVELQSGGKGSITIEETNGSIKWENDDTTIKITLEGETATGTLGTDSFKVEDMFGMGVDLTFAKEGTAAADPAQYLPETDKFMLGTWQSTGVTDILGDPIDMDPYALFLTFTGDHTGNIMFEGKDLGTYRWSLLGDWGNFDDEDAPDISWDIKDGGLEVSYVIDGEYYIFDCPKGGSIPDSAMSGGQTSGGPSDGADYFEFWENEWYGWWIMDNATGEYETLDGGYWDVCGGIYMDDDSDDTGFVYLWDETGNIDDPLCVVDVSFGEGTTDAGSMVSEDGWFWTADVGHADWIVDPGASSVSGYDHMIEIYGSWEDDDGSYDYYVYLRPWGMDWEDVRADDPTNLPYYYDSWYVDAMNGVMPDEMPQD